MIDICRCDERARYRDDWCDSYRTFASTERAGAWRQGFRSLRGINEERMAPGRGGDMHAHQDVEIITYVIEGAFGHNDGMNNGTIVLPGDLQRMTAGRGIVHKEFNHSGTEPVHLLQIWVAPERNGLVPGYEQRMFVPEESIGSLLLLASRDGRSHSVTVHQDLELYLSTLEPAHEVRHRLGDGRAAWVQIVRGSMVVNGALLHAGDGAALTEEPELVLEGNDGGEALVFDLGAG